LRRSFSSKTGAEVDQAILSESGVKTPEAIAPRIAPRASENGAKTVQMGSFLKIKLLV
jgi:hypothetical protein